MANKKENEKKTKVKGKWGREGRKGLDSDRKTIDIIRT